MGRRNINEFLKIDACLVEIEYEACEGRIFYLSGVLGWGIVISNNKYLY